MLILIQTIVIGIHDLPHCKQERYYPYTNDVVYCTTIMLLTACPDVPDSPGGPTDPFSPCKTIKHISLIQLQIR